MQSVGAFLKPCARHSDKKVDFICCKEGCNSRLICGSCVKSHDKSHENHLISIREILTYDLDAQLVEMRKLAEDTLKSEYENIKKIEKYLDFLTENFLKAVQEIKSSFQTRYPLNWESDFSAFALSRKKVLDFDPRRSSNTTKVQEDFAEIFSKYNQKKEQLKLVNKNPLPPIQFKHLDVEYFKNIINQNIVTDLTRSGQKLDYSLQWIWDSTQMSSEITLGNNGKIAKYSGKKDDTNHVVFGANMMAQGVFEWYLDMKCSHEDSGIAFGIMKAEDKRVTNLKDFDGEKGAWRASNGEFCFQMTSTSKRGHVGIKTKCVLDFVKGKFEIHNEKKMVASADIDKKSGYYPFVGFFNEGEITLSFK